MMETHTLEALCRTIDVPHELVGAIAGACFSSVKATLNADEQSLTFVAADRGDKQELIEHTRARVVICDPAIRLSDEMLAVRCFILVKDPKLAFAKAVSRLLVRRTTPGIHPTAFVERDAELDPTVCIGPFAYIGRARIGKGSVIQGHVYVGDDVVVHERVSIGPGCMIGSPGFGYLREDDGTSVNFPHLGGVEIHDDVEIGANTCIDRGALENTVIMARARIDNLVHVAHNVVIGEDAFIIALAMLGGSSKIGAGAWISPSAVLRDTIRVGARSLVGLGAVVTKDVPAGQTWTGVPARPLEEFLAMQTKLKTL